jgi:hypothetical protein
MPNTAIITLTALMRVIRISTLAIRKASPSTIPFKLFSRVNYARRDNNTRLRLFFSSKDPIFSFGLPLKELALQIIVAFLGLD